MPAPQIRVFAILKLALKDTASKWLFILTIGVAWVALEFLLFWALNPDNLDVDGAFGAGSAIWAWTKFSIYMLARLIGAAFVAIAWHRLVLTQKSVAKAFKSPPLLRYIGTLLLGLIPVAAIAGTATDISREMMFFFPSQSLPDTVPKFVIRNINTLWVQFSLNWMPYFGMIFAWLMILLPLPQVAIGRKAQFWAGLKFSFRRIHKLFAISALVAAVPAVFDYYGTVFAFRLLTKTFALDVPYGLISGVVETLTTFLFTFISFSLLSRISEIWRPIDSAE